ncbi:flavodoxin domain-containing protein [Nocardia mexicana]|uniref:Menaquinone-dependent protoporphyrinogen oxidase n=1 Tax=Nocardia mexicana TaxID=279262 RepID=A0A370HE08_9NOCA|nr:flavodoxin domain-containing protein [Nocardia mexicana]RDI55242.1 menaquinone-dependent protoporphyrinogen oxidase [Nocardia mexicana]
METNKPRIAVIYATAQGSTREIAEYIAEDLANRGADVEVADAEHAPELSRFDAVVLGSAVHGMDYLPAAGQFVRDHRDALAARDVWMFSVGVSAALRGPIGRRMARRVPQKIATLRDSVGAKDFHAFAGHYERAGVSFGARLRHRLLGGGRYGDLRDWAAITAWTETIARALRLPQPRTSVIHP